MDFTVKSDGTETCTYDEGLTWCDWPTSIVADIGEFAEDEIPKCPDCGRRTAHDGLCSFCVIRQRIELRDRHHKRVPFSRPLSPDINRRMLPCNRTGQEGKNLA